MKNFYYSRSDNYKRYSMAEALKYVFTFNKTAETPNRQRYLLLRVMWGYKKAAIRLPHLHSHKLLKSPPSFHSKLQLPHFLLKFHWQLSLVLKGSGAQTVRRSDRQHSRCNSSKLSNDCGWSLSATVRATKSKSSPPVRVQRKHGPPFGSLHRTAQLCATSLLVVLVWFLSLAQCPTV